MMTTKDLANDLIDGLLVDYKKPEDLIGGMYRGQSPKK
jgi:hypothetical protein